MTSSPDEEAEIKVRATSRSLTIALLRARERVMGPIRAMLADVGVTEQQWRVLRVLAERGATVATEIAREACLLMPSLTRILQYLEKNGLCTRHAHPTDRRRHLIEITADGYALIEDNIDHSNRIFAELESEFGKDRVELLLDLLNELAQPTD